MRYLVTGGIGFIGHHLVDALCNFGHEVVVLDEVNLPDDAVVPCKAEMLRASIIDSASLARSLKGCDGIFHLAALSSAAECEKRPALCEQINVAGSRAIFYLAEKLGGIPIVYTSSAAVYGETATTASKETDNVVPQSVYGLSKLKMERLAERMAKDLKVPSVGLRLFNVYGPYCSPPRKRHDVISRLLLCISAGTPFTLFGSGEQTRDFIFVDDAVQRLIAAMPIANYDAPIVNICTGKATSVAQLINVAVKLFDREILIQRRSARPYEVRHSIGNPNLSCHLLGLENCLSVENGLVATARNPFSSLRRG